MNNTLGRATDPSCPMAPVTARYGAPMDAVATRGPLRRRWTPSLISIAIALAVLGLSWWWLEQAPARLPAVEDQLFTAINGWPDWLRPVLWPVMQLGNFWVWLVGALAALVIWRRPAPAITVALATFAAWF